MFYKTYNKISYHEKTLKKKNGYSIYTKDTFYEVEDTARIITQKPHSLGMIPIIEYTLNGARLGAFEVVLTLLDTINTVDSNRVDGIEQFVQAIMLLKNVRLEEGALSQIKEEGAFEYKDMDPQFKAEVKYITQELKQYEETILGAEEKILALETRLYSTLVEKIQSNVPAIQENSVILSKLDVLAGFASLAYDSGYCRPVLDDSLSLDGPALSSGCKGPA